MQRDFNKNDDNDENDEDDERQERRKRTRTTKTDENDENDWIGETSVDSKNVSVSPEIIFNSYYGMFAD